MTIIEAPSYTGNRSDFEQWLTMIRRDIHKHPETAFEEKRTGALVADYMESWGIEVHRGLAKTGVVGTLHGKFGKGRRIGLRADMDALFISENTNLEYSSQVPGKMHACGHDGHTTMLLGAARALSENPNFAGTVHFIFQPAEEAGGGAKVMIEEGLFERFPCDAVYGMHNMPTLETGRFGIRPGPMLSSNCIWQLTFTGTGGHAAFPFEATEPALAASTFVGNLSNVVSRHISPSDNAVVSVGYIGAGNIDTPSILPSSSVGRGSARSYTSEVNAILETKLKHFANASAQLHDCKVEFEYTVGYPSLINHDHETAKAIQAAQVVSGNNFVDDNYPPVSASEDFAFMLQEVPGCYILIGNGSGPFVHTPEYDFNDKALLNGVSYWQEIVFNELGPVEIQDSQAG